uniref:peptidylprolyl isomerase n=1 Tax=Oncorhynchus mykiss TaxID=8022 RepID=A0A8C7VSL9_ONCMY
ESTGQAGIVGIDRLEEDHLSWRPLQMVSIAPGSEMETEPCPGEQEKRVVETNEPELKEAYTGPGDKDSQKEKELSHGPQQEDTEPHGEGDPRTEYDRLLRKKVLAPGPQKAEHPAWGQEVTVKMQGVLEDRSVVEKDRKLVFVIGEGDVNQALEECAMAMQQDEITLLLADSQYTYGLLGREPDIPAWAPLLYQLQLLNIREKPDPLILPMSDRIRIGNQKRERGNFHFQREEYSMATRAYWMALDVLTTHTKDGGNAVLVEGEEVQDYRVKCLNNLAAAQLKLEQYDDALHTSRDVLSLDPQNVKALFRTGKLLSDKSEYGEAMEILKKALKLEPSTKAIHVELSKLVKRQSGGKNTQKWQAKPAQLLGDNIAPFLTPNKKPPGISWKFLLGALVVALGSLVTSVVLTARN